VYYSFGVCVLGPGALFTCSILDVGKLRSVFK